MTGYYITILWMLFLFSDMKIVFYSVERVPCQKIHMLNYELHLHAEDKIEGSKLIWY